MIENFVPQGYALWAVWQSAPGRPWEHGPVLGWRGTEDGQLQPVVRSLAAVQEPPTTVAVYVLATTRKEADGYFERLTTEGPPTPGRRPGDRRR